MSRKKTLHDGLRELVSQYGQEIYRNSKLLNYLNDYCQFEPMALYHVMRSILSDGYSSRMVDHISDPNWAFFVQQSIGKIQKQYGYQAIYVNYCFQSLAYGIGLYPAINQRLLDELEGKTVSQPPVLQPKPSSTSGPTSTTKVNRGGIKPVPPFQPRSSGSVRPTPTRQPNPHNGSNPPFGNPYTQQPKVQPFPQNQPNTFNGGCMKGCFDNISNMFYVIILILWILIECS